MNEGDNTDWTLEAVLQNKTVLMSPDCTIIVNKSYTLDDEYMVNFGWDDVSMFMDRTKRN